MKKNKPDDLLKINSTIKPPDVWEHISNADINSVEMLVDSAKNRIPVMKIAAAAAVLVIVVAAVGLLMAKKPLGAIFAGGHTPATTQTSIPSTSKPVATAKISTATTVSKSQAELFAESDLVIKGEIVEQTPTALHVKTSKYDFTLDILIIKIKITEIQKNADPNLSVGPEYITVAFHKTPDHQGFHSLIFYINRASKYKGDEEVNAIYRDFSEFWLFRAG